MEKTAYLMAQIDPIRNPVVTGIKNRNPSDAPALVGTFIASLVGVFLAGAAIWAFFQLLQGGISYVSSGGDKTNVEAARDRIFNAIIGLVIVAVSWAIFLIIVQYLGIASITPGGGFIINFPTLF